MIINGKKYIEIYEYYDSLSVDDYNNNKSYYIYTLMIDTTCINNINISTGSNAFYCFPICTGKVSDNFIFYDKINNQIHTDETMRATMDWIDEKFGSGTWLNTTLTGLKPSKYKLFLQAYEKRMNSISTFNQNAAGRLDTTTYTFNWNNYNNSQLTPLLDNIYCCYVASFNSLCSKQRHRFDSFLFESYGGYVVSGGNDSYINNSLWYKKTVEQGFIEKNVDSTILAVDWTVYIDGTYNPTIKITWKSDYFDFDETGNTFDTAKAFIGYGSESPFNVDWQSGSFTTSYKEVIKVLYPSIYEKIIEGVGSLLDAPSFSIRLLGATLNSGIQVNSGTCFFVTSSKGTVSESGLAEGSEGLSDTITIIYDNDSEWGEDEESDEPSENDEPSEGEEISVKGFNLLTLTYALTPNRLAQLGSFIWGASFLTNLKLVNNNPIENIVSCKMFPFTVTGGADTSIKLGNVETGINGNPVSSGGYSAKKVINGFTIAPLFNNFLDYEPYTKISVFLPFIGIKELQPSQIMNKVLSLEYVVDIVTGICKCIVKSGGKQIADYDGSIGIDIPITSSNRAQVELSYITSALGVVGSIAMGSPLGVVGSVLSGASSSYHSETKGTSSPTTGVYGAITPFVIFDRPKYTLPSAYGKTKGFVCNKTCTISSLSGFTVCHENVKLNGISCTNEELEEIKSLLTSGFFA